MFKFKCIKCQNEMIERNRLAMECKECGHVYTKIDNIWHINDQLSMPCQDSLYDDIAEYYDKTRAEVPVEYYSMLVDLLIKINAFNNSCMILDIGCGTGQSSIDFIKNGYSVLGCDTSVKMLNLYTNKISNLSNFNDSYFFNMNALKMALTDHSIDVVVVNSLFHLVSDYKALIAEIERVLTKKGILIVFQRKYEKKPIKISNIWDRYYELLKKLGSPVEKRIGADFVTIKKELIVHGYNCFEQRNTKNLVYDSFYRISDILFEMQHKADSNLLKVDSKINKQALKMLSEELKKSYGDDYRNAKLNFSGELYANVFKKNV